MKTILLNSAMMPTEGTYSLRRITANQFFSGIRNATNLVSYIGYPQNAAIIREKTGRDIPVSRNTTTVTDGDVLLIMKLPYRIAEAAKKGQPVSAADFEYFRAVYSAD